jgi:hypothetical protein
MGSHPSTERCDPVACVTQLVACQVLNPTMLALDVCVNTLSCQCALTIVWGCVRSMVGQIMCNHCWVMMFSSALQPPALIVPRTHPPPQISHHYPPPPPTHRAVCGTGIASCTGRGGSWTLAATAHASGEPQAYMSLE